jgi:hypothetical protein
LTVPLIGEPAKPSFDEVHVSAGHVTGMFFMLFQGNWYG